MSMAFFGGGVSSNENLFPMKEMFATHRQRLVQRLFRSLEHEARPEQSTTTIVVYLVGGKSALRYDTDHEPIFRQESYFFYLTGVQEPDCAVRLCIPPSSLEEHRKEGAPAPAAFETTLYFPRLPPEYATVMGPIRTREQWKERYAVDQVQFWENENNDGNPLFFLSDIIGNEDKDGHHPTTTTNVRLLLLKGRNSDSGAMYEPPVFALDEIPSSSITVDTETLFPILAECRVLKSPAERYWLRFVTEITSFAHTYVMRHFRAGMYEYQAESLFRHYCHYNYGARLTGYTPICACGPRAAILHYGHAGEPNDQNVGGENALCLLDLGAEYRHYGSDVTCTFPATGRFTIPQQRVIYEAVLNAQRTVYAMMRPGVSWVDCHVAAEATILFALLQAGLLQWPEETSSRGVSRAATTIAELVEMRLGAVFMPHGLGHFIGLDTHDVGGYLAGHPVRPAAPGLSKLRTARVLQEDMVLTVEPGCYFIDHLLDEAMADDSPLRPYLNVEKIHQEYRGMGGVRLEDVVQVTATGIINYTLCPRTIAEVESVMAGGKWPPLRDAAPELCRVRLTDATPLPPPP